MRRGGLRERRRKRHLQAVHFKVPLIFIHCRLSHTTFLHKIQRMNSRGEHTFAGYIFCFKWQLLWQRLLFEELRNKVPGFSAYYFQPFFWLKVKKYFWQACCLFIRVIKIITPGCFVTKFITISKVYFTLLSAIFTKSTSNWNITFVLEMNSKVFYKLIIYCVINLCFLSTITYFFQMSQVKSLFSMLNIRWLNWQRVWQELCPVRPRITHVFTVRRKVDLSRRREKEKRGENHVYCFVAARSYIGCT